MLTQTINKQWSEQSEYWTTCRTGRTARSQLVENEPLLGFGDPNSEDQTADGRSPIKIAIVYFCSPRVIAASFSNFFLSTKLPEGIIR